MTKGGDGKKEQTERRLWELFDEIRSRGEPTGPTDLSRRAGIHRTYLYQFPVLAAEVAAYGRKEQPKISRRGAGVTRTDAVKRAIDIQVRREHAEWSEEIPKLRKRLEEAEETDRRKGVEIRTLTEEIQKYKRAFEYLLLLASEAGVHLLELERIREKVA